MATLTLPNTLTPGTFEDVGDVQENFVAIRSLVNGGLDGDNVSQATGEALSLSATNYPRRGRAALSLLDVGVGATYTQIIRAPAVVMPAAGILHVSMTCWAVVTGGTTQVISYAIRLNGATARSRFGVAPASGASTGLMEITGLSIASPGTPTAALLFTDTTDTGLGSLISTNGTGGAVDAQPAPAFAPIVVSAGACVVDLVARVDSGTDVLFYQGALRVRTEAF